MSRAGNPFDYARRWWMRAILAVSFLFLYFPIVALIAFSSNSSASRSADGTTRSRTTKPSRLKSAR